ncbi:hypothetical protein M404DRAFT_14634 [Pisolithus tinctorius Marx 270]|uniref:Peptidase S8/S53 domain-containing protein n=1 Tax=Pisolithus tinctorius Marx 270 TaxID=870435 RepID=A0A0C3JFS0_PISTI|nr:hypothetical protein M404DRAFT_14634 [Pisolithus tinctorius Marx 270]
MSCFIAGGATCTPWYYAPTRTHLSVAPLHAGDHPHGTIDNSYIVAFREDVSPALMGNYLNFLQMTRASDSLRGDTVVGSLRHICEGGLERYAGKFTERVVGQIPRMPEVNLAEKNQVVRATFFNGHGLVRISHRPKLTSSIFTKYVYDDVAAEGVDVSVIDAGIHVEYAQFEDLAALGLTVLRVKVLGSKGSGSAPTVVTGVKWTRKSALAKAEEARIERAATRKGKHRGSVGNMTNLSSGKSTDLDTTVNRAVDQGFHFAVATDTHLLLGNGDRKACKHSPAGAEKAVTVGASTLSERAYFSNYGKYVKLTSIKVINILSTCKGGHHAIAAFSGTFMASPPHCRLHGVLNWNDRYPSIYTTAYMALPRWIVACLPPPEFLGPIPSDDCAFLKLSSKDPINNAGDGSSNKLIFNSASSN